MKINEICKYAPKSNIKAGEATVKGSYMFFTSSSDESKRYCDYQFDGEGVIMGTGGNATLHYYNGKYSVSTDCVVLLPDERVNCKYLYYFFLANMQTLEAGFKGAGLKHTNKNYIGNIEFGNIPSIEKQQQTIDIFDKLSKLIDKRKQQLQQLDELVKARFVELFGDPYINEKNWAMKTFGDICTVRQGLQIPISKRLTQYDEDCYEYITVAYLHGSKDREYIKSPKSTVICTKDDILMTRTGNTGMVVTDVEGVFHNNFFLIDFDRTKYSKRFLVEYLNLDLIQTEIIKRAGTSTIPDLNHGQFYAISIYEPPIELQNQFTAFVEQTDKSKVAVQKALDEAQTLFDSLMQEYFE